MDLWQLSHLAFSLVLPLRPEDFASLLIRDVDFVDNCFELGGQFGGRDFNKGKVVFRCPFPADLRPLLSFCCANRADGPLLRSRSIVQGRRRPRLHVDDKNSSISHIEEALRSANRQEMQTSQDQKRIIRQTIKQMGGISGDELRREFNRATMQAGLDRAGPFYDLRARSIRR
jgi:hypothetical protein